MKAVIMPSLLALWTLSLITIAGASIESSKVPDEITRSLTEGKLAALEANQQFEKSLRQSVDEKQVKAIQLINVVGTFVNDRFSNDLEKGEASDAYGSFIARFQSIREDRESFERKELSPDLISLQNYSKRLDSLIPDIQKFLK